MNLDLVRELIDLIRGTGVAEVEVETEQGRVRVRMQEPHQTIIAGGMPAGAPVPSGGDGPATGAARAVNVEASAEMSGLHTVISPFVGVFYRSPKPDQPPFVEKGDMVEEGQVLCIVEAMKLMNELTADRPGRIVDILLENGQNVEYGEALFLIEPA
jgi:acetyl-CoA carboxylase biotin carboxyl carrier protein